MGRPPKPSSAKIEFTRREDLQQACYEASVDVLVYVEHIRDIARRCEKTFPEVAEGLRGTAAGLAQYMRGVDGEWRTMSTEALHEIFTERGPFKDYLWAYEFCRDPRAALLLMGNLAAVASAKQELTFWQALEESRSKLSDWEPLIAKLLESSPLRRVV